MSAVEDPVDLLTALVATESVNPDLVPGAVGEAAIAAFCAEWLKRHGFEVTWIEDVPGRPSVVGVAKGTGGGRSLMFNGHIDTVTLAGYDGDPLDPVIADGRLYGRGSFDMKGGVAAMMVAAARAARAGLRGDVLVACVADEEHASFGTEQVAARFRADAAIVTEPSHLKLTIAHRGFAWFEVAVIGRAAHGSLPEAGIDAIARAGHVLVAIEALDRRLRSAETHPLLRWGSVHASTIRGGQEMSSYPAECVIGLERRTLPGETPAAMEAEMRALLEDIASRVPDFRYELRPGLHRPAFETPADAAIVRGVSAAGAAVMGSAPALRGEPFWTDCAILAEAGIPCVMFGAHGAGAHAATEWTDIASVRTLAGILERTAVEFCG
jgi:acetylornithine deacetylase